MTSILTFLTDALDQLYNDPREGIHVSDLALCPRKALFRRLNPAKTTPTELNFFTLGKSLHQAAQDLTKVHGDIFVQEQEVWMSPEGNVFITPSGFNITSDEKSLKQLKEKFGIDPSVSVVAHIDIYNKRDNIPVEMKGIRKADIDQPKPFHVQQLKYYMAMTGADTGIILYQLLLNFKDKPFKEFIITMTPEQREAEKQKLIKEMKSFGRALATGDPKKAHAVINDEELNWQCDKCPYLSQCQQWSK